MRFRDADVGTLLPVCRLVPSLMREGSYSTIRLGAYEPLKRLFGATDPAHTPLWKKLCAGACSGASPQPWYPNVIAASHCANPHH